MKKIYILMAGALILASCAKEAGPSDAKAVLGDVSVMEFPAQNPSPKSVTVVSDGTWHVTAPSWIIADPETGSGETVVTVTVSENMDAQGLLAPRKDTLILSGSKLSSRHLIIVSQAGDSYRNAVHATVSEIAALSNGSSFILDEGVVAAVTGAGFVVTDGSVNVYVNASQEVSVGDKVSMKGIKGTVNGVPVVSQADGCSVTESGTCEYPEPLDLNGQISTYPGTTMDYVKASGVVSAGNLVVTADETEYVVKQIDAPADMSLSSLNGHKVTLWGYSYGILGAKMLGVLATKVQDDGLDQVIYFEDNFEWLAPYSEATNAPDDVADNSVGSSPNIFTNATAQPILTDLQAKGYGFIWSGKGIEGWQTSAPTNGNGQTLYLQKNYLKFGKSDYSSGLVLPAISSLGGATDVKLTFDWCWCMTGKSKPDTMTLTVEADGETTELTSEQPTENDLTKLEWQHATVIITGVTANTRIVLRPTNTDPYVSNSARGQNRWYLDNIKIVPADGGAAGGKMSPGVTVFEDNLEWLAPYSTAVEAPDDVADNKVNTTKNIFTTDALKPILSDLQTKGYGYIWGGKGKTEWSTATPEGDACTLYLLKNYLKFGKTDWNSGLVLPALGAVKGSADVELTFDWCWCMTGKSKPDIMTLTVEVEDGEKFEVTSAQPTADDLTKLEWQHASVTINDVTSLTRIILRPTNVDPNDSCTRGQNRWYLDNIKIVTK